MTTQTTLAAFAVVLAHASGLSAQRLPGDLAWTGLPANPADFPQAVSEGQTSVRDLFRVGCLSEGGYAGAAYAALVPVADNDLDLRHSTMGAFQFYSRGDECPGDPAVFESALTRWLRQEWEADLLDWGNEIPGLGWEAIWVLRDVGGTDPDTYDLLREIARDPNVFQARPGSDMPLSMRMDAALAMLAYRMREGLDFKEAVKSVSADLDGADVLGWPPARPSW